MLGMNQLVCRMILPIMAASLVAGCFGSTKVEPTRIEAIIVAADNLNPDLQGRASPLVVRIYQLKSPAAFNSASFFSLSDRDKAELGDSLKGKDEIELVPGQKFDFKSNLEPDARFIGILGEYRDYEHASWRAVTVVETGETTKLRVNFTERSVTITTVN